VRAGRPQQEFSRSQTPYSRRWTLWVVSPQWPLMMMMWGLAQHSVHRTGLQLVMHAECCLGRPQHLVVNALMTCSCV